MNYSLAMNFPLFLTLTRLILSPVIMPFLLVYFLPLNTFSTNSLLALTFALFGFTDFLDGYLARHYRQVTTLGKLLDPIADKFLVYSTLIALVYLQKINLFWTIIIIGREFFVMGLREIALIHGFDIPVARIGKIKTVAQLATITYIILNPFHKLSINASPFWNGAELLFLLISFVITLYSGIAYWNIFKEKWNNSSI